MTAGPKIDGDLGISMFMERSMLARGLGIPEAGDLGFSIHGIYGVSIVILKAMCVA